MSGKGDRATCSPLPDTDVEAQELRSTDFSSAHSDRDELQNLGILVKARRGGRGLRELAAELTEQFSTEISPSALSRVESGKRPGTELLRVLQRWLEIEPDCQDDGDRL